MGSAIVAIWSGGGGAGALWGPAAAAAAPLHHSPPPGPSKRHAYENREGVGYTNDEKEVRHARVKGQDEKKGGGGGWRLAPEGKGAEEKVSSSLSL
jgi:hypothetical protein